MSHPDGVPFHRFSVVELAEEVENYSLEHIEPSDANAQQRTLAPLRLDF